MPDTPAVFLVDNGSLQPAATRRLRALAALLASRVGLRVEPVSLLHSSAIDPVQLDGAPAEILEPAMRRRHAGGRRKFVLVPLFFGPSAAITEYIPARVEALTAALPGLAVRVAAPLVDASQRSDTRVAGMLADHVCATIALYRLERPGVIMVDHGSPLPAVGAVRDLVAAQLARILGGAVSRVVAASMERRDGAEYDFNEPLLARALADLAGNVVVAPLFFSPGRHAGPGGDVEQIGREAEAARPDSLRVFFAPLVGEHPALVDVLEERLLAVLAQGGGIGEFGTAD